MARSVQAPLQERSVKTQEALVEAFSRLLASKSFSDVTMAEIAAEAGVTTGAIYGRFKDKRGLLHAAFDRFMERSVENDQQRDEEYKGLSDREVLERMIRGTLNYTLDYIPLMRAASAINDDPSFDYMRVARNSVADWLAERFTSSPLPPDEVRHRTRFAMRMITAVVRDTFLAGPGATKTAIGASRRRSAKQQRLINQLVSDLLENTSAYLQLKPSKIVE